MARYCFYCNRELATGESCQCRLKAREDRRRDDSHQARDDAPGAHAADAAYTEYNQTRPDDRTTASRRRPARLSLTWADLKPQAIDFVKPLDQLEQEKPRLAAAVVWMAVSLVLQGLFVAVITRQAAMFFLGVLFGLVSLLLLAILLFIRSRIRSTRRVRFDTLFARARPVYLYASLVYVLAILSAAGNPLFGSFLFLLGDLAAKAGLLWQLRQSSPLDRNRFFLTAVLTIAVHTLIQSVLIQSFLRGLFAGF